LLQRRGRRGVPIRETFDLFFCERIKHCADSLDDATTLQRTQDAGHDNDFTSDDDWDIVYNFDYTIDSSDDYTAADDLNQEAILLADYQQVEPLSITYLLYHITVSFVPYFTALILILGRKINIAFINFKNHYRINLICERN
jgi:hypothetical protein